jgi:HEPN domain-containing protein
MSNALDPWAKILLAKAAEDEAVLGIEENPDGAFGFHAQQAAEKLLKALLSQPGIGFQRTHDLTMLAAQLSDAGDALPSTPVSLRDLNKFAVVYRYDSIPDLEIPDRPGTIETVRLIREHVLARIAALSATPQPPPLQ